MGGFEPPTVRLRIECSTTELHRQQLTTIASFTHFIQAQVYQAVIDHPLDSSTGCPSKDASNPDALLTERLPQSCQH